MTQEIWLLAGTAASIGFVHTIIGPDHYLPFIFMSRARKWSILKTSWITIACGVGHVGSSVLLGLLGIGFGVALSKLEFFEGFRGDLAAWAFVLFGLVYLIWGIHRAILNKPHHHVHYHDDGTMHTHDHTHSTNHDHEHKKNITPWILFTIFVLGPCEPLIPLLMYPASESSLAGVILISLIFSVVTIITMLAIVLLITFGISFFPLGKLERYTHVLAGAIVFLSGIAILLGL